MERRKKWLKTIHEFENYSRFYIMFENLEYIRELKNITNLRIVNKLKNGRDSKNLFKNPKNEHELKNVSDLIFCEF